ncbi:MAG: hypothetical protein ACE5OY_04100 [Candidatus Bathyarchaeia archaeon]
MSGSLSREEVDKLTKIRNKALSQIEELKGKLSYWETITKLVEDALARKGFKKAAEIPSAVEVAKYKMTASIKTKLGEKLADMHIGEDFVKIVPVKGIDFVVDDPAFQAFFVRRVIRGMEEADKELVKRGSIRPEQSIALQVDKDDGKLREIIVKNPRERVREIRSAIEWTLRRMFERVSGK